MRLLLAGFGNVGTTLASLLADRDGHPGLAGLDATVVGITTGSHGAIANALGLDLAAALESFRAYGAFAADHPDRADLDTPAAVATLDYDVLVELSPLSVRGRGEPAIGHVRAALDRGRHVVTANKGPVAWAYRELSALAERRGVLFRFEAAVMDGAPVFNLARHCLRGNRIERLEGVLNSTTNVVLEALAKGLDLQAAVARAQMLGVAEADPALDLDGWDAAVKLAALVNVLMDAELAPEVVARESVGSVTGERLAAAAAAGRVIKMVCAAERRGAGVAASVRAVELARDHPLATAHGTSSVLRLLGDLVGTIVVAEEAPDLRTTAYGVIADLFEVADRLD